MSSRNWLVIRPDGNVNRLSIPFRMSLNAQPIKYYRSSTQSCSGSPGALPQTVFFFTLSAIVAVPRRRALLRLGRFFTPHGHSFLIVSTWD